MNLLCGHDKAVASWVAARISYMRGGDFGQCSAIGVVDGDHIIAGVVYHDYRPQYLTMQVSMAATSPRWARRGVIRALLSYPFEQAGVEKLWSTIASKNDRALKFNLGIGFEKEAVLAKHFGNDHAVITRMFRKTYERLYLEKQNG